MDTEISADRRSHRRLSTPLLTLLCTGVLLRAAVAAPAASDRDYYNRHIIAVDADGSAMLPNVTWSEDASGRRSNFKAKPKPMAGERLEGTFSPDSASPPEFRKPYYEYIHAILDDIARLQPKRVVIYIHGGMNFITGAAAKGAQLAEDKRGREREEYRIAICWSSNLFSTYEEHVARNSEGLNTRWAGIFTAPFTLVSDLGSALSELPASIGRLLTNDLHALTPDSFDRDRHARERKMELDIKEELGMGEGVAWEGIDSRAKRPVAIGVDVTSWALTAPAKIATVSLVDSLGSGAWDMMKRRTRTMFERETQIGTAFRRRNPTTLEGDDATKRRTIIFRERAAYAARMGAVRLFLEETERFIENYRAAKIYLPEVTLIGHSMGAIVATEMLARTVNLQFDHIVFMAAACSVNDFLHVGVPYMRRSPRTRFYNLCLNAASERAEAQPGRLMVLDPCYIPLEIAPRGSLLIWIDSYYEHPESEGDRTLGRWENALLMSDTLSSDIAARATLKAFGRERPPTALPPGSRYTVPGASRTAKSGGLRPRETLAEPQMHGDFSRFRYPEDQPKKPSFDFTNPSYRAAEKKDSRSPALRAHERQRK